MLRSAGDCRDDPERLLRLGYTPKHRIDLFDTTFYLANVRQNPDLRFFVGYVAQPVAAERTEIWARIFYKDISLIWRAASHLVMSRDELWIGKGDVLTHHRGDYEWVESLESTTDLPFEVQTAFETVARRAGVVRQDTASLPLVLRRSPSDRIRPYRDFTAPRRRAAADPRNLIHGGRPVAWFLDRRDPSSLVFAEGYEPDFDRVLETSAGSSTIYGGPFQRFRILSRNEAIQHLFFAAPRHVWMIPPQALTTELSSFGVRTIDVEVDEDAYVPGLEYHFLEDEADPDSIHSQIPDGWVGPASELDPTRADASRWLDQLPVIRDFRRRILGS